MGELHYVDLRAMTRDERAAGTDDDVGVLLGGEEVASFPVPPRGESMGLSQGVRIAVVEGADEPISLRVKGTNAWGPREAIVAAQYSTAGGARRTCAVAVARPQFDDPSGAGVFLSASSGSASSSEALGAVSRYELARFRHAGETDLLDQFMLVTATDRARATTRGPLELTLRASIGGVPVVLFQTVLPKVGRQEPGQAGGYLYRFQIPKPGVPFALLHSVTISNRSDDAWGLAGAELYGWRVDDYGRPVGGLLSDGPGQTVVSQDVSDRFPEPDPALHLESGWHKHGTTDSYAFRLFDRPLALP